MVVRELFEEVFRPGDGCLTWVPKEVVEADVVPSASEEESVGGDCDFGVAAEAEAVVEKIDLRFNTQDCVFEGLHAFASMVWDWMAVIRLPLAGKPFDLRFAEASRLKAWVVRRRRIRLWRMKVVKVLLSSG